MIPRHQFLCTTIYILFTTFQKTLASTQKLYIAEVNDTCTRSVCDGPLSDIYCHGPILAASWHYNVHSWCPGTKLRFSTEKVLDNFARISSSLTHETFVGFCRRNFDNVSYLEYVEPADWDQNPPFIEKVTCAELRKLSRFIHNRWRNLSRRFTDDVTNNPGAYPVIPVKHPFIVPGGFFQVYFYWDSYWITKGLLVSNMSKTVKGSLQNFADIVDSHGFIPNSGDIHLSGRTQPPLFIQMVHDYYDYTKDIDSVKSWLPSMEKEMKFWATYRMENVANGKRMFLYKTLSDCPRPENYLYDVELARNNTDRKETWRAISSACESGWDFSSRWFAHEGDHKYEKSTVKTHRIVPVDLNVFMALNFYRLSNFYLLLGDLKKAEDHAESYRQLHGIIEDVMWEESRGSWFDYDLDLRKTRQDFYPTNMYPLLLPDPTTDTARITPERLTKVYEYLKGINLLQFPGGVPSTLPVPTLEQWDYPNVWAPNQHLFIQSLLTRSHPELRQIAKNLTEGFLDQVYNGLFEPPVGQLGGLWEKYDARSVIGRAGGGGEYPVQEGFGWTNGAVLDLIISFPEGLEMSGHMKTRSEFIMGDTSTLHVVIVGTSLSLLVLLAIWYICCGWVGKRGFEPHGEYFSVADSEEGNASRPLLAAETDSE